MLALICRWFGHARAKYSSCRDWHGRTVDMWHCPRCQHTWTLDD